MEIRRINPAPTVRVSSLAFQVQVPEAEPRHILEKIVWHKTAEVDALREQLPLAKLKYQIAQMPAPRDFLVALTEATDAVAVIAEVKKASPSQGVIRADFDPIAIAKCYVAGGATCLSVLTDREFFQGSDENLQRIRAVVELPLLCKEFIINAYQLFWARALGADAVLLIAQLLSDADLRYFLTITRQLGMTALVEVHSLEELDRVLAVPEARLIGINNRDLTTFAVSLETTANLVAVRQEALRDRVLVGESGIHSRADLDYLAAQGVRAVLVGESLMRATDPAVALQALRGAL